MKNVPLSIRLMLALLLAAVVTFGLAFLRTSAPDSDMAFLAALFCACGVVGWMMAADLQRLGTIEG